MIIPNGLDKPRSKIEVSICILSADILFMKKLSKFEKFAKNVTYFKKSFLFINDTQLGDDQKQQETSRLKNEDIEKNNEPDEIDSENVFVRITFAGSTVSSYILEPKIS